jgi:hypothetical protein
MKIEKLVFCLGFVLFAISCKKEPDVAPVFPADSSIVNFSAFLNGRNEVPANVSTNTGVGIATYDKANKLLSLSVVYSGFTAVDMHIHRAPAGVNGGVLFPLGPNPWKSPVAFTRVLTTNQEDSLMRGLYYINIHSATYPGGEIRGQLNK